MKTLRLFIIKGIILFSIANATAQNGYNTDGYGRVRSPSVGPSSDSGPTQKDIDKNRKEKIKKTIEKLTKELILDELQVIAISKVITDNDAIQNIIISKKDSQEVKNAELKSSLESTDRQIMAFLDKEQKEKYTVLIEKRKLR